MPITRDNQTVTLHNSQPFRLILASASPRRRELLTQAGYIFDIESADVDETPRPNESPAAYVQRLAEEKAQAVLAKHAAFHGSLLVLGADTTVVVNNEIFAKPADAADAKRMLSKLSGRTHQVLTGIAVASSTGTHSAVETTEVVFSEIPAAELDHYCSTHEPLDKAGAYGIQGYAARWIPRIDGDYFNVMGLPIARTVRLIQQTLASSPKH